MKLVFRYLLYAVVALIGFTGVGVVRYPDRHFITYVPDVMIAGTAVILIATAVSLWKEDELADRGKGLMMRIFLIAVLVPTVFTAGAFLHERQTSWTGGEVHYHADMEVVVDGEQIGLISPEKYCQTLTRESSYMCSVNDRVGTTKYHDHNDDRIHLEGTFKTKRDASLAAFFEAFQGELTGSTMRFPTNDGWVNVSEQDGKTLKIIVMRGVGGSRGWCVLGADVSDKDRCIDAYSNDRVTGPSEYVISPYTRDPTPGAVEEAVLDKIWVIYDQTPAKDALQDLREDNAYTYNGKTFTITKSGEGYK